MTCYRWRLYVNVPAVSKVIRKKIRKNSFLLASWILHPVYGSMDPDPSQNVTNPEHWLFYFNTSTNQGCGDILLVLWVTKGPCKRSKCIIRKEIILKQSLKHTITTRIISRHFSSSQSLEKANWRITVSKTTRINHEKCRDGYLWRVEGSRSPAQWL
jgi:hypothetical protein